jgi:hypothetical protein
MQHLGRFRQQDTGIDDGPRSHESVIARGLFIPLNSGEEGDTMCQVTIKTGLTAPDGCEEVLTEYLCDYPNCPNFATRLVGCLVELRLMAAVCELHAYQLRV